MEEIIIKFDKKTKKLYIKVEGDWRELKEGDELTFVAFTPEAAAALQKFLKKIQQSN